MVDLPGDIGSRQRAGIGSDPDGVVVYKVEIPSAQDALGNINVNIISDSKDAEGGGKISVGTSRVELTFSGATKTIIVTADIANTGTLYVGKSDVGTTGANALFPLQAGQMAIIEYDDSSNALFVVASASSQNFWKGALL